MTSNVMPDGWISLVAADSFDQISTLGKSVKTKDCSVSGKYPVVDQGQELITGYIDDLSCVVEVENPIVLFGDHTRAVKWIDFNFVPGADGTKLLKPKLFINNRFSYYQLKSLDIPDKGYARHFKYLKELSFVIPPLAEQQVIADKIDILLAQVESIKARLERIPEILKQFRQSVLTAAVSGKLTEEWRKNNSEIPTEPKLGKEKFKKTLFETAQYTLPELPKIWKVVPAANILEYVTSGSRGWSNYYSNSGALFLRMSNVRYDTTKLDLKDLQYVDLPENIEGKRSLVKKDDLLVSITADVGRVGRVDRDFKEAYVNQHLALLRPTNEINAEFLAACIASQNIGVKQVSELKRGATKAGLGLDDIRSLAIPFPTIEEQNEIVHQLEYLFRKSDTIEIQFLSVLDRVNNLTQSILAKAFRGELTAEWREANPELISGENSAEALLKRIKAERELVKPATKRGRGKA
ncbi:restriction endonuclease subunit S [Acinetobacter baumannii]|uniref:restriction endonuclease subunit S n=1 Tax=Acinetobacter baumannii TaxID=470 RepID=UPI002340AF0B|nr:restriction endonuclease subunit S [Acinetobacter baumannii]MDC5529332.1 restriction endonuclease subunit S [Acinetobacter baumannii]MDD7975768.1 restriction endonuclease subunit S [Acinetobacter baumannii]MDO8918083.1 restriction endonuclease subunit S [Acinetobacter baumannii]